MKLTTFPRVRVPMLGPEPTNSSCTAGGRTYRYVRYTMPESITRALGMGCTGRTIDVAEGRPAPVAVCEQYPEPTGLVCVNIDTGAW